MRLSRLQIQNFKSLRDVVLEDIPAFNVLIGPNGSGKSSVLEALAFVRAMVTGRGQDLGDAAAYFSRGGSDRTISFDLEVAEEGDAAQRCGYAFEAMEGARTGFVFASDKVKQGEVRPLAAHLSPTGDLSSLFLLKHIAKHSFFSAVYDFIEGFRSFDLRLRPRDSLEGTGALTHRMTERGTNAHAVVRYLSEKHPEVFRLVERRMAQRIPGVQGIEPLKMEDGRIALRFREGTIPTPFLEREMSEGTLDMLVWLLILNDPDPPPLLCAEEPEGQINPHHLGELAEDFELFSEQKGQVFVTTHSPDFLNAVPLESLWVLSKENGETRIHRAADKPNARAMAEAGDLPGQIWMSGGLA